jgi:hypothetical protein
VEVAIVVEVITPVVVGLKGKLKEQLVFVSTTVVAGTSTPHNPDARGVCEQLLLFMVTVSVDIGYPQGRATVGLTVIAGVNVVLFVGLSVGLFVVVIVRYGIELTITVVVVVGLIGKDE